MVFQLIALVLRGCIFFYKNAIIFFFIFLGKALFRITFPLYNIFLSLKKIFLKFYSPLERRHYFIHPFTRRYFIHILVIGITVSVSLSNLNQFEVRADDTSYNNILSTLIADEEFEETFEEGPIETTEVVSHYLEGSGVRKELFIDDDYSDELFDVVTRQNALVKPILSPIDQERRRRNETFQYLVQEGDTISGIAKEFGVSINTILWENNLTPYNLIRPGQKLTLLPVAGIRHKVLRGDTLEKIAKKYSADTEDIMEFNRLVSAHDLKIGELLIIPGGKKLYEAPTYALRRRTSTISKTNISLESMAGFIGKMLWPNTCRHISQYYHWRHHGIDISCNGGNIKASADGIIAKAQTGWNGGYGIMVIIDHGSGMQTLYAHLSKLFVNIGDNIKAGDALGSEGSTGRSTGKHVHFEVRSNGKRLNPLSYIK